MKLNIWIILIILGIQYQAFSQEDFSKIDEKTYEYYIHGNWSALTKLGEKAIDNGIDYYYLNYRLGVAYHIEKNYLLSAHYFEKAIDQNKEALQDSFLVKTLFNNYLYTLQFNKIEKIKAHHPSKEIRNRKYTKRVSRMYLEGGISVADNITQKAFEERKFYAFKEINQFKNLRYTNFDFKGYLTKNLKYQLAYTNLTIDRLKFYKSFIDTFQQDLSVNQSYIYLGLAYNLHNFEFGISLNSPGLKAQELSWLGEDSIFGFNIFDTLDLQSREYVAAANVAYQYKKMKFGVNGSYSNLLGLNQYQFGIDFTYFPSGNLNSYMNSQFIGRWENGVSYLVLRQKFGMKFTPYLWGEMRIMLGNLKNYNADNAYYVYNTYDNLKSITDFNFIILINKNLEANIVFQSILKENSMQSYPSFFDKTLETTKYNFQQFNIIGGLQWKF